MTTTAPALTPKQKQVLDLLDKGVQPPEIAKKLKISPSGVYGHIRNMKKAGVGIPNGLGEPTAPPPPPPAAEANGTVVADPAETLKAAIGAAEARMVDIDAEVAQLGDTITILGDERTRLVSQVERYNAALTALA